MNDSNRRRRICRFLVGGCRPSIHELWLFVSVGLLLLLTMAAPGCRKSTGGVAIHGHVSFQGEPLANAALTFFPASGRPVTASVVQGEYATELAPGEYTAVVDLAVELPTGFKEGDPLPPPKIVLPEEYTSRRKSTLKATVKAGQSETIDFAMK